MGILLSRPQKRQHGYTKLLLTEHTGERRCDVMMMMVVVVVSMVHLFYVFLPEH